MHDFLCQGFQLGHNFQMGDKILTKWVLVGSADDMGTVHWVMSIDSW